MASIETGVFLIIHIFNHRLNEKLIFLNKIN